MGYRDDECRLVKSSVGQFNVSKDTTTCMHILENRHSRYLVQGIMIILVMMKIIFAFAEKTRAITLCLLINLFPNFAKETE